MVRKIKRQKTRALLLFSGGLDSILSAKILKKQGIEVVGMVFESYFFDSQKARQMAKDNGIKIIIKNIALEHLEKVRRPLFGYGKGLNPCLDCHLLMLQEAKKIFEKEKFDILATGEVLGQRPFSQNRQALEKLEKEAKLVKKILRPLSAQKLPPTIYEERGLVDRKKLFSIAGRSRKIQLELAKKLKVKSFPSPAGGCILTEIGFSQKLKNLLAIKKNNFTQKDFELLKLGRHFWKNKIQIILGKNKEENERLVQLASSRDIILERKDKLGPTALIRVTSGKLPSQIRSAERIAQKLIWEYSKKNKPADFFQLPVEKKKKSNFQKSHLLK